MTTAPSARRRKRGCAFLLLACMCGAVSVLTPGAFFRQQRQDSLPVALSLPLAWGSSAARCSHFVSRAACKRRPPASSANVVGRRAAKKRAGASKRAAGATRNSRSKKKSAKNIGADIFKMAKEAVKRKGQFEAFVSSLTADFPCFDSIATRIEEIAAGTGDWSSPELHLTGSCLRGVHTQKSDIDYLLSSDDLAIEPEEWNAFAEDLRRHSDVSQLRVGEKAIEFAFLYGKQDVNISIVAKNREMDADSVPMQKFLGNDKKPATSRADFHNTMTKCYDQYPGARNVAKFIKVIFPFKGFVAEALVKRAAMTGSNWENRAKDRSGFQLMKYMLQMFTSYPHYGQQSPLHSYLASARAMGQDDNKVYLDQAKESCRQAQEIATKLLGHDKGKSAGALSMPLPLIVALGSTGSGKSSFIQACIGNKSTLLSIGDSISSETQEPTLVNADSGRFLDTPGFGDSEGNDEEHMAALAKKVRELEEVSLFALVFNSQQPRLDDSLKRMLTLFENMFGSAMWTNVAIVFTRWSPNAFDEYDSEADKKLEWNSRLKELFPSIGEREVPCFFVDSVALLDVRFREKLKQRFEKNQNALEDFRLFARHGVEPFRTTATKIVPVQSTQLLTASSGLSLEGSPMSRFLLERGLGEFVGAIRAEKIYDPEVLKRASDADLRDFGLGAHDIQRVREDNAIASAVSSVQGPLVEEALTDELLNAGIPAEALQGILTSAAICMSDHELEKFLSCYGDLDRFKAWRQSRVASLKVESGLIWIGARIKRGLDCDWDDFRDGSDFEDEHEASEGVVIGYHTEDGKQRGECPPQKPGWARARWLTTGLSNVYRIGDSGKYDLLLSAARQSLGDDVKEVDEFSAAHLRPTFRYLARTGSSSTVQVFDIRSGVCERYGRFRHGDMITLSKSPGRGRSKAVVVGVRACASIDVLALWVQRNDKQKSEGATPLSREELLSARVIGNGVVTEYKGFGQVSVGGIGFQENDILDDVRKDLQPTFGWSFGEPCGIFQHCDIRKSSINKLLPEYKHGDIIRLDGIGEFVLIGVAITRGGIPKLWFHEMTALRNKNSISGALVLMWVQKFSRVGWKEIGERKREDCELILPEADYASLGEIAAELDLTFDFPLSTGESRSFDIRPDIVKRVSGKFTPGQVLRFPGLRKVPDLVVVGVTTDEGLPVTCFWRQGDVGARSVPRYEYGAIMRAAQVLDEVKNLTALKSELMSNFSSDAGELLQGLAKLFEMEQKYSRRLRA